MNIEKEIKELENIYKSDEDAMETIARLKDSIKYLTAKQKEPDYNGQTPEQRFKEIKSSLEYWNPIGENTEVKPKEVKQYVVEQRPKGYNLSKDGTRYYIEDPVHPKDRLLCIRQPDHKLIQRYDWDTKKWVDDVEMLQIYSGDIETNPISEIELEKYIKDNQ